MPEVTLAESLDGLSKAEFLEKQHLAAKKVRTAADYLKKFDAVVDKIQAERDAAYAEWRAAQQEENVYWVVWQRKHRTKPTPGANEMTISDAEKPKVDEKPSASAAALAEYVRMTKRRSELEKERVKLDAELVEVNQRLTHSSQEFLVRIGKSFFDRCYVADGYSVIVDRHGDLNPVPIEKL
jgi:vacuolar-type H+-ATPase subunit I/STV1